MMRCHNASYCAGKIKTSNSDQIKSVNNTNPTHDPDIRYSRKIDGDIGVNINSEVVPYVELILNGDKTVETRLPQKGKPYGTLHSLVGKRIGLVETGKGKAVLKGYATISEEIYYPNVEEFEKDYERHRVPKGSEYYSKGEKYGYVLTDVVRCEPIVIEKKGIKVREVPYEFAINPNSENDGKIQNYKSLRSMSGGKLTQKEYNQIQSRVLDEISYHYAKRLSLDFTGVCRSDSYFAFYESYDDINPKVLGLVPLKEVIDYAYRYPNDFVDINSFVSGTKEIRRINRKSIETFARELSSDIYDRILQEQSYKNRYGIDRPGENLREYERKSVKRTVEQKITAENEKLKEDVKNLRKLVGLQGREESQVQVRITGIKHFVLQSARGRTEGSILEM